MFFNLLSVHLKRKEDIMQSKIFVRERRKVEKGEKKPRFRVLGVSGSDIKIYVKHIRKQELDQVAQATGAEVVYIKVDKKEKSQSKPSS
jgi:hypothetical protein